MNTHFFAWYDKDSDINIIAFGTEDEITNDRLTGENLDYDEISELKDLFYDTEEFGEDYLISTNDPLVEIDEKLISLGYIRDKRLKNVGWG